MTPIAARDLPPEKEADLKKARKLEWITMVYVVTSTLFLGLTMGSSQAMRASFFENTISLVPAIAFLVCSRIARRNPNKEYPYGFHGVVSIGYLTSSLALLAMGAFVLIESLMKFATGERATIGGIEIFGHVIWAGWPMLAALAYTSFPSIILGRLKLKLAPKIHDKILYADAKMMKADWMTEFGTAVGVLGIGLGIWWLDPLAAAIVGVDILKDGWQNLGVAVNDLIERRPMKTDQSAPEPLPDELRKMMEDLPWVESASVRLREVGHVFFGEVFITPKGTPENLPAKVKKAMEYARELNWRLYDVTVTVMENDSR